ncbi:hypothetical protein C8J33_1159 [Rhizobium sp. PP-CC-3G-465]|nr:hypothetical protein C8J33_1159 [Rhizobium sp. PP-CC-3G-465]
MGRISFYRSTPSLNEQLVVDQGDQKNAGFGLVAVLVFILLLAAVITPLAIVSRANVLSTSYIVRRTAFELLAPSVSSLIGFSFQAGDITSTVQKCERDGSTYFVVLQDQNGLIGLNSAGEDLLAVGFQALGISQPEAAQLSQRIAISRQRGSGQNQSMDFHPKHAAFEHLSEIEDIISDSLYNSLDLGRVFTVYNRTDGVDPDKASFLLKRKLVSALNSGDTYRRGGVSSYVEIELVELEKNREQGFLFRAMLERPEGVSRPSRIVEQEFSTATRLGLQAQPFDSAPCEVPVQQLIGIL